jgi:hypothetical protein
LEEIHPHLKNARGSRIEFHLKAVECAQFNFHHRFRPIFVQFGRNFTHDWFLVRRFGQNSASLEEFRPILALVRPKSVAEIELRLAVF